MNAVVIGGSGVVGSAVAWDLAQDPGVDRVGIVGRGAAALEKTRAWIGSPKVITHPVSVENRREMATVLSRYDVGVITLPDRRADYLCVESALDAGLSCVDVLEEYHRHPEPHEVERLEVPAGVT